MEANNERVSELRLGIIAA